MKRKTWQSKLTKEELTHLKVMAGATSLAGPKRTFEAQKEMRKLHPGLEPCFDCKHIALKLGIEV